MFHVAVMQAIYFQEIIKNDTNLTDNFNYF